MTTYSKVASNYNATTFDVAEGYPERIRLEDAQCPWGVEVPGYAPANYTSPHILGKHYADPEDISRATIEEHAIDMSHHVRFNEQGRPLYPYGRTGIEGRGLLGRFGPNYLGLMVLQAAGSEEVLIIKRAQDGNYGLPGGYMEADKDKTIFKTAIREAREEVVPGYKENCAVRFGDYYMLPDPKTTDNAWIMAAAIHDFVDAETLEIIPNPAEVESAFWMKFSQAKGLMLPAHVHALERIEQSVWKNLEFNALGHRRRGVLGSLELHRSDFTKLRETGLTYSEITDYATRFWDRRKGEYAPPDLLTKSIIAKKRRIDHAQMVTAKIKKGQK